MSNRPNQGKKPTGLIGQPTEVGNPGTQTANPSASGSLVSASYQFTGPIPSPQDLARYEAIIPGLADRLITRFEKQSDHRMAMEREVIQSDMRRANWGLGAGFIVAIASIAASGYVIATGHDTAGTILGGTTIASLVGTFVYGTRSRRQERKDREKMLIDPEDTHDQEG